MKAINHVYLLLLFLSPNLYGQGLKNFKQEDKKVSPEDAKTIMLNRGKSSMQLSIQQDNLSADVQELSEDQTNPKVIELFDKVEVLMHQVTDNLEVANTDKETLYNETLIIEKIFEAAKEKSK